MKNLQYLKAIILITYINVILRICYNKSNLVKNRIPLEKIQKKKLMYNINIKHGFNQLNQISLIDKKFHKKE